MADNEAYAERKSLSMADNKAYAKRKSLVQELRELKVSRKFQAFINELVAEVRGYQASMDMLVMNYNRLEKELYDEVKKSDEIGLEKPMILFQNFSGTTKNMSWLNTQKEQAFLNFIKKISEDGKKEGG